MTNLIPERIDDWSVSVDDLASLSELNAESIIHILKNRFLQNTIYTNTGTILLAVNPFQRLTKLYESNLLEKYLQAYDVNNLSSSRLMAHSSKLTPHIYQVAGEAYKSMVSGISNNENTIDQSILVSGESGSGKTESTKILLQYLAQASARRTTTQDSRISGDSVMSLDLAAKVVQTNALLESFGNARTIRNDNSSRFGKFIKLHFTTSGRLTGASIQSYLLEKVRLVSQSVGERNYHIFYEMVLGASDSQRKEWLLDPPHVAGIGRKSNENIQHYRYLNQSKCEHRRDGVRDEENFDRTIEAMKIVGFTTNEQTGIFHVLAALLHLGNLTFEHLDEQMDRSSAPTTKSVHPIEIAESNKLVSDLAVHCIWSRDAAAELLTVKPIELERALSIRKIRAGSDYVAVKLSADQANNARDALAKALYGRLFDWLVQKMNDFLKIQHQSVGKGSIATTHFIGLLDIFGFEVFSTNSLEQLCINFANEALQQQFNDYIFKMEQHEYKSEGVSWDYVEFLDNQDCVNLISQRPMGILSLVDEECLIPKGTDTTFASKVYRSWEAHPRFSATRREQANGEFTICHYAGKVTYSSNGFLEKNKDLLHQEAVELLMHSTAAGSFTRMLCENLANGKRRESVVKSPRQRASANKARVASVGLQFKEQLSDLIASLQQTTPHYIRCFKPNDAAEAEHFDPDRVLHQLKCSGVMEAVRVARAGFPVRLLYSTFIKRFGCLYPSIQARSDSPIQDFSLCESPDIEHSSSTSKLVLERVICKYPNRFPITKNDVNNDLAARGIQLGQTKIFLKKNVHETLESLRTELHFTSQQKIYAVIISFATRKKWSAYRNAVVTMQCIWKFKLYQRKLRALAQQRLNELRRACAIKIQTHIRMRLQQQMFKRLIFGITSFQVLYRYHVSKARTIKEKSAMNEEFKLLDTEKHQQIMQYKDSYTASDSSSQSEEESLASNDVEGYSCSTIDDFDNAPMYGRESVRGIVARETVKKLALEAVDEINSLGNDTYPPNRLTISSKMIDSSFPTMDNLRPLENKLYNSDGPRNSTWNQHNPHQTDRARKDSNTSSGMRSTYRSSRSVALPRLEVVQETNWINDEDRFSCHICNKRFSMFKRKHHCRACGEVICNTCSLYHRVKSQSMRVCVSCVAFHQLDSPTSSVTSSMSNRNRGGSGSSTGSGPPHPSHLSRKTSGASVASSIVTPRPNRSSTGASSNSNDQGMWSNAWPEPPFPDNEDHRLLAVGHLDVGTIITSGNFNMYCEVASKTFKCPIAYVSIMGDVEQTLIASIGMAHPKLPRELSFCAHTICQAGVLVVLDAKNDPRFRENPMVKSGDNNTKTSRNKFKGNTSAVKIRYYAGVAIYSLSGYPIGTIAVMDTKPRRQADQEHIGMLQHLSHLACEKMSQHTGYHDDSESELL